MLSIRAVKFDVNSSYHSEKFSTRTFSQNFFPKKAKKICKPPWFKIARSELALYIFFQQKEN